VTDEKEPTSTTNTTGVPLSDVRAVPSTSPEFVKWDETWVTPFADLTDTLYKKMSEVVGVDLSAFVAIVPTYAPTPLNPTFRELVVMENDELKAMSKKKLRRRIRTLEAMVLIRDRKIKELEEVGKCAFCAKPGIQMNWLCEDHGEMDVEEEKDE
jgi:hypothetical protein